jgi:recombination protein RecT
MEQTMSRDNAELASKVADRTGKLTPLAIQEKLGKWKDQHAEKLVALAGSKDAADKVFVICLNTVGKNPDLLECTFESIASCILQSFQLNLFPGPFQECGYVPLRNGKTGRREANFWPQYQGLVKLMRNAGNKSVVARVVFENDFFDYHEGAKPPVYCPAVVMGKKRGKPLFVYSAICTAQDMWQVEVLDPDQIETVKNRSKGAKSSDSPWNSKYEDDVYAMWAKTALKRVGKWCTKSPELATAIDLDNEVDGDPNFHRRSVIEMTRPEIPLSEPEQLPQPEASPTASEVLGKAEQRQPELVKARENV